MREQPEKPDLYFVDVKSFPLNVDPIFPSAPADGKPVGRIRIPALNDSVELRCRLLSSYAYNERFTLESRIDLDEHTAGSCRHIVLRVLPVGSLVAHYMHRLDWDDLPRDTNELRRRGENLYAGDLYWSDLVFEFVEALECNRHIRPSPVAHCDILDPVNLWSGSTSREVFVSEMEWRAWASGNYFTVSQSGNEVMNWPTDPGYEQGSSLEAPEGRFQILYNNYFGWNLSRAESTHGDDAEMLASALEPIAYMITRRSQCASGISNVKALSRSIVWGRDAALEVKAMRRYVSSLWLALLAPREYEESSDKKNRRIYAAACEDLEIDKHVGELNQAIEALNEEVRGLQAERDERAARRLNVLAIILTCIFGVSAFADIAQFIDPGLASLDWETRLVMLGMAGLSLLVFVLLAMLLARR